MLRLSVSTLGAVSLEDKSLMNGGDIVSDALRDELIRLGFAPDEIDELTETEALYIYEEAVKKGF